MKLSRKPTCINCFALDNARCKLGFDFLTIHKNGNYKGYPSEPCYKPKTKKQYLRAKELIKNA